VPSSQEIKRLNALQEAHIERLSKEIIPFKDTGREASAERLAKTEGNIEAFKLTYMPHYLDAPSAAFHDDLDTMMQYPEKALFLVHSPREHAKSVQCRMNVLEGILNGRIQYWIFGAEKVPQAYQHIDAIFVELAENFRIKADYEVKILRNDSNEGKFRARVTSKATGKSNTFQLEAVSDGTSGKGLLFGQYRPQGALIDDLEKLQDQYNPENGRKKNSWVRQELYGAITGVLVWLGNMGRKTSALHQAFEEIYTNEEELKQFKHNGSTPGIFATVCARNGGLLPRKDDLRIQLGFIFKADRQVNGKTEYLWPQRFKPSHYDSERRTMGYRYHGEMNGDPRSPGKIFNTFPTFAPEDLQSLQFEDLVVYTWLDPAWGKSNNSAFKCWVAVAYDGHYFYLFDAYCRQGTPIEEAIDAWYECFDRWAWLGLRDGGFEKTFAQDDRFYQDLELAEQKHGKLLPVYAQDNPGEKTARIESMEGLLNSGRVIWPARLSKDMAEVKEQVESYPEAKYVDAPDALEACLNRVRRRHKGKNHNYQSIAKRRYTTSRRRR
jgi:hypothetical protein